MKMSVSKKFLLFACWALLFVSSSCKKKNDYSEEEIERGDEYIDKLLKDMFENRVEEYDPYKIEDNSVGFHRKVAFVNVSGEAKLHDGYITGLKTLHRPQHCALEEKDDRLHVKADLGAGELKFHYSGTVKFMNIGPTITVHGTLEYVEVHLEFDVDAETGKDGKLTKFVIDDMRGMKVWVTGLGPMNWAVNPIVKGVTIIFKRLVRNFLENRVEKHIAARIPDFQFPVEGVDITETEEPVVETEEPVVETEEPVVETEEPVVETEEPVVETEEPVVETEEPVVETEEPVVEETDEPVVETEEPVVEETEEPVVETEEPVVEETEEPVVETEEPVVEETEEPVVETEEPVVETEEPVVEETEEPVIPETEEPVVEETEEPQVEELSEVEESEEESEEGSEEESEEELSEYEENLFVREDSRKRRHS